MRYTREQLLASDIPEEVKELLMDALGEYFKNHSHPYRAPTQHDYDGMFWNIYSNVSSYEIVAKYTHDAFGETDELKLNFWHKVLNGDHKLFFDTIKVFKGTEHIVNGQKFMV